MRQQKHEGPALEAPAASPNRCLPDTSKLSRSSRGISHSETAGRIDIADAKSRVSLADILDRLSTHSTGSGHRQRWSCLNPDHADNDPSLTISRFADGGEGFRCHSCGLTGDVVSALEVGEGLSRTDAIRRLGELAGLRPDRYGRALRPVPKRSRTSSKPVAPLKLDLNPERPPPDECRRILDRFLTERKWTVEAAKSAGLEVVNRWGFPRVRFPVTTVDGRVTYYQDRVADPRDPRRGTKYACPAGSRATNSEAGLPFGAHTLAHLDRGATEVWALEGPADALALWSTFPHTPAIAALGATSWGDGWAAGLAGLDVWVCVDNDPAGETLRSTIADTLDGVATVHHVRVPPPFGDLDEWRAADVDAFPKRLVTACEGVLA